MPEGIKGLLLLLRKQLCTSQQSKWTIDRRNPFKNACRYMRRRSFNVLFPVFITFTDSIGMEAAIAVSDPTMAPVERGIDLGALSRSFYVGVFKFLSDDSQLFAGPADGKHLSYHGPGTTGTPFDDYELAGRLMAMSVVQKGPGPNFFCPALYCAVITGRIDNPTESIVDPALVKDLDALRNARDKNDLRKAVLEDNCMAAKMSTFPTDFAEKEDLIEQFVLYHGKHQVLPLFESLRKGLSTYGLLQKMEAHPSLFQPVFCVPKEPLTAEKLFKMFEIERSERGNQKFIIESTVIQMFNDFLIECEEGTAILQLDKEDKSPVTLGEVLLFASGTDRLPPLGFDTEPRIKFHHEDPLSPYPTANACVITLYLPVAHKDNDRFNQYLCGAVRKTRGFDVA